MQTETRGRNDRGWHFAPLIAATFAIGCALTSDNGATDGFTRTDSAGIAVITNVSITKRGDYPLGEPITVIGSNSADSSQLFTRAPAAILVGDHVVTSSNTGAVSVWDQRGQLVRNLVRRGSGPGEMTSVARMLVRGDTLMLRGGGKMMWYSTDNFALLREDKLECPQVSRLWDGRAECAFQFFSDGWALGVAGDSTIPVTETNRPDREMSNGLTSPGPGLLRQFSRLYAIPPSRDTSYPLGLYAGIESFGIALGPEHHTFIIHPFYSFRSYFSSNGNPRRFAVALNPEYNIEVWNDHGVLTHLIRRTGARRVPTPEDHAAARTSIESQLDGVMTVDKALSEITVPDSLPAFDGLIVSPRGEVIVQTAGWRQSDSSSVFDVFDSDGVWGASWTLPRRARVIDIDNDKILFTRLNEDDVPLVEVRKYKL